MSEPRERPILFSGEMISAILDGKKCQTRRVIKPQPDLRPGTMLTPMRERISTAYWHWKDEWWWQDPQPSMLAQCPYGAPGDKLWVRETWGIYSESWTDYGWEGDGIVDIGIQKSLPRGSMHSKYHIVYKESGYEADEGERWKPSIFMPRWASRLTLEVVSVKVERVSEICVDDVVAEGIELDMSDSQYWRENTIGRYAELWDSLNAKRGFPFSGSPWCWAITFRCLP